MKLKYFTGKESLEEAKLLRNKLAKKHHPDLYPDTQKEIQNRIMSEINSEYEFIITPKEHTAKKDNSFQAKGNFSNEDLVQMIFICLVTKPLNVEKLVFLFNSVKDWNELLQTFYKKYGKTLAMIIAENVKDKFLQENLTKNIRTVQKINNIGKTITSILNKLFN